VNANRRFQTILVVCVALLIYSPAALAVIDDADMLYVGPGESYTLGGAHSYNVSVEVAPTGILYITAYNGGANTGFLELYAPTIIIDGILDGNGRGYRGATYQGQGEGPGGGSIDGAGGGYGGAGGNSGWGNPGGPAYGTATGPDIQMGSGGGMPGGGAGGNGGGMVRLEAHGVGLGGMITVNGANGLDHGTWDGGGGGSGGGIFIKADLCVLHGFLSVDGGTDQGLLLRAGELRYLVCQRWSRRGRWRLCRPGAARESGYCSPAGGSGADGLLNRGCDQRPGSAGPNHLVSVLPG